jgi:hypothetical protein
MKNTPMSAMKLPLLVDLQQKVGEWVVSITYPIVLQSLFQKVP